MKNNKTPMNQVSLAGAAKVKPQKPKKKIKKWVIWLVLVLVVALGFAGKYVYDAVTAGPSLSAEETILYEATQSNLSGKVAYYVLGVTGEKSTDRMDMVAMLCLDRKADTASILQVPVSTYIGKDTDFATSVLGDVWGKPQPHTWCPTCRENLPDDQVKSKKHTVCGSKVTQQAGSSFSDLCRVFNQQYGLPTDNFLVIPRDGLAELIDSLGGVDIKLSKKFSANGITYKSGVRTLPGAAAVYYVTEYDYDGTPASDVARMERQRQLLAALLTRLSRCKTAELYNADIASRGILSKLMNGSDPVRFESSSFGKARLLGYSEARADGIRSSKALTLFAQEISRIPLSDITCSVLPGVAAKSGKSTLYSVNKEQTISLLNECMNPYGLILDDSTVVLPALAQSSGKVDTHVATLDSVAVEQTGSLITTTVATTTNTAGGAGK